MLSRFYQWHRFCLEQGLYPVVLSTWLAGGLLAGRVYLSETWTYLFLAWNLFLAWLPYLASLWVGHLYRDQARHWGYMLLPGLFWLVFFPNAPYLVTDFLHLQPRAGIPLWYDIGLITAFAWTGLFLAVFSLRTMQSLVKRLAGGLAGGLFVFGVVSLSGLGIYLGRFLGWNSWDLLFHPRAILADVAVRLVQPHHHLDTFAFTFMFAAFLLVCYLTIAVPGRAEGEVRLKMQ